MRSLITDSWHRSQDAQVDIDAPEVERWIEQDSIVQFRAQHALATVYPLLYDVVGRAAVDCDCIMAVGDELGRLLWVNGSPSAMRRVERIQFVEGTDWSERRSGTNAPGIAVRLDAPVQVRSREHYKTNLKDWFCAAAPIHHPDSGAVLGVIDVTGTSIIDNPQTLAMLKAAARMAESDLARQFALTRWGRPPQLPVPVSSGVLRVSGLDRVELQVEWHGQSQWLSRRQSDIFALLADRPDGIASERLAAEVYEFEPPSSTLRAQMTRLRALFGDDLLSSRPYRLNARVRSDWHDVLSAIRDHRLDDALNLYTGPLLPTSDAPGIAMLRDTIESELMSALVASEDPDLLATATRARWAKDNLELWEHRVELLPRSSPEFAGAAREVDRLRDEYGISRMTRRPPGRLNRF